MTPPETALAKPILGSVVSIGVHILDILGRPVTDIPPGQRSVIIDEIRMTAAGTAAGVSVDLAKLGVDVLSLGAVGDDDMGDYVVTLMNRYGVNTDLLTRKTGERTSATILPIRPNGERPALHAPGANGTFSPSDLAAVHGDAIRSAAVVHIGGPDALPNFPPARLAEHVSAAKSRGAIITMDLLRVGNAAEMHRLAPLLAQTDWLLPNDDQVRSLTGHEDLTKGVERIHQMGVTGIAITLGADGCLISDGHRVEHIPSLPISVVDTTGCGDGFDAGFIAGLLLGADPLESVWLATACGGLVATGLGSDAGISNLDAAIAVLERSPENHRANHAGMTLRKRMLLHEIV